MEQRKIFSSERAEERKRFLKVFPPEIYEAAKEITQVFAKYRLSIREIDSAIAVSREITSSGADEEVIRAMDELLAGE